MTDLSITDFRRALRASEEDTVEMLWLELLEEEPVPVELAQQVLDFMGEHDFKSKACELAELLESELMDSERLEAAQAAMRRHAELAPDDRDLKRRYAACMKSLYGDRNPQLGACLRQAGITGSEPLTTTMERLDRFTYFQPGEVVWHGSWNLGTVDRVNPRDESIIVDFSSRPGHRFSLDMAQRALWKVDPDSLAGRFARDEQSVKKQAQEDPASIIRLVLRHSEEGSMDLSEVREKLTSTVLDPDEWSSWWQRTRPRLVDDHFVEVSGSGRTTLRLREEAVDPVRAALEKAQREEALVDKIDLARRLYGRVPSAGQYEESTADFAETLLAWADDWAETEPGAAFCAWRLAQRAADAAGVDISGGVPEFVPPTDVSEALEWLGPMQISRQVHDFLDWLEEERPELIEDLLPSMLESGPNVARDVAFKQLSTSSPAVLEETLEIIVDDAERLFGAFLWICSQILRGRAEAPFDRSLASLYARLLRTTNALEGGRLQVDDEEQESLSSAARNLLLNEDFLSGAMAQASADECRDLRSLADRLHHINDTVVTAVRHHLSQERPEIVAAEARRRREANAILTTRRGLTKRRQELEKIVHVDMPENRKELGEAARFGDLSENAEYETAREQQFKLADRAETIQKELDRARVPSTDEIDTSRAGFGTRVHAVRLDDEGDQEMTYDILGPWDSDPDKGIISYLAPVAKGLEGAEPGEERSVEVGIHTRQYKIKDIELSPRLSGNE